VRDGSGVAPTASLNGMRGSEKVKVLGRAWAKRDERPQDFREKKNIKDNGDPLNGIIRR